jgi:hypothetical protein
MYQQQHRTLTCRILPAYAVDDPVAMQLNRALLQWRHTENVPLLRRRAIPVTHVAG